MNAHDPVNHPQHYTAHPSGIECIQITEHMNFNLGNAVKYIWRAGEKGDRMEDLRKARWYLDREIARLEASSGPPKCDPQCSEGHRFDETCAAPGGGRFDG
jgi:hypothetical protein